VNREGKRKKEKGKRRRVALYFCFFLFAFSFFTPAFGASYTSVHGFALDDPGLGGRGACSYCHATHGAAGGAGTALWSQRLVDKVYTIYSSSTLDAKPGQPTGSTKLCLSCHDGTIAPAPTGEPGDSPLSASARALLMGELSVGTDLSDDHPVSFAYGPEIASADPQIKHPGSLAGGPVKLDKNGEMQCTSCHDAHKDVLPGFLVMDNRGSALCLQCHQPSGWSASVHATSTVAVPGSGQYATLADNGCNNCHVQHHAGSNAWLLISQDEERNCLACHDGTVSQKNVAADIQKSSGHKPDRYLAAHDPKEDPSQMAMHMECSDCHNPHAIKQGAAGALPGSLASVPGVNAAGVAVAAASAEYEICFKCHADNPDRVTSDITRQVTQTNTRLEFSTSNPSYHPVMGPGASNSVPSLINGLTVNSVIKCSDCHASDSSVRGPHGSTFSPLLVRNYATGITVSESPSAYALCYVCHNRTSILGDQSFRKHKRHIQEEQIPCSACHDAHGVQGSSSNHARLINFDTSVVTANDSTRLEYVNGGCYLKCHGKNHNGETGD